MVAGAGFAADFEDLAVVGDEAFVDAACGAVLDDFAQGFSGGSGYFGGKDALGFGVGKGEGGFKGRVFGKFVFGDAAGGQA